MTERSPAQVLVVDDTPQNIMVLDRILHEEYSVRFARSGAKALELAATDPQPDIILLDIMMPEMDGYEVCRRLKADPATARIPVIFVTAMGEVEDESRGFGLGAADYITKPVSAPIVRARVRAQLALYDQTRTLDTLVQERTEQLEMSRLDILWRLGRASELRDEDTGNHIVRVAHYAKALAEGLGLDREHVQRLFLTAPLHDVGKIGISDQILLKPGRLSDEEFAIMRTHAAIGAAVLTEPSLGMIAYERVLGELTVPTAANPLLQAAAAIALTHHEKFDGTGYPAGLADEAIPLDGRIVALVDVYDALTVRRPYKPPFPPDQALAIIKEGVGKHFDPAIHDVFVRNIAQMNEIRTEWAD